MLLLTHENCVTCGAMIEAEEVGGFIPTLAGVRIGMDRCVLVLVLWKLAAVPSPCAFIRALVDAFSNID